MTPVRGAPGCGNSSGGAVVQVGRRFTSEPAHAASGNAINSARLNAPTRFGPTSIAIFAASRAPFANSTGDQAATISRDLAPIWSRAVGERSPSVTKRDPITSRSSQGTANPFSPSWTRSAAQPHSRETITGRPAAIASLTTRPQGSTRLT